MALKTLKSLKFLIPLAAFALMLSACHRDCVCQGYDGGSYTYTEEEVDARGVTCANMIFLGDSYYQYYSVCDWE